MLKIYPSLISGLLCLALVSFDGKVANPSSEYTDLVKWELIFEEEFDQDELDSSYWESYQPQPHASAWNYYVNPNNKSLRELSNGHLLLSAKWDSVTNLPETGAIQTKDKFSFRHGKLEVKARFNRTGQGAWPAIWLMPQNSVFPSWPDGGEIDVMERLNHDKFVYQVIHQSISEGVELKPAPFVTQAIDPKEFNTYGIIKTPEKIEFYVNDQKTMTYTKGGSNSERWPFETDYYLILNHATADKGESGTSFWPGLVSTTEDFPYEMAIDYVKVWKSVTTIDRP
jgi:beta-glucanase (GH16 family)